MFLQFSEIATEENHDVISVYHGSPDVDRAQFIASFTGDYASADLPNRIVSSNNFLIIVFDTDNSNAIGGTRRFRATWKVGKYACALS